MRAQLTHLIEAAAIPSVTLHVLPTNLGARPALSAAFTVLSFEHLKVADMAYVEHPMGSVHIQKPEEVEKARLTFSRLQSLALNPADTVEMIKRVAEQM